VSRQGHHFSEEERRRLQKTLLEYLGLSEVLEPEPPEEVVDDLLSVVELPGLGRACRCRICNALFVSRDDFERHRLNPDPLCRERRLRPAGESSG
jgi:DNA-directed RNA polymerase subunit F